VRIYSLRDLTWSGNDLRLNSETLGQPSNRTRNGPACGASTYRTAASAAKALVLADLNAQET
jgi:hypothetical protein